MRALVFLLNLGFHGSRAVFSVDILKSTSNVIFVVPPLCWVFCRLWIYVCYFRLTVPGTQRNGIPYLRSWYSVKETEPLAETSRFVKKKLVDNWHCRNVSHKHECCLTHYSLFSLCARVVHLATCKDNLIIRLRVYLLVKAKESDLWKRNLKLVLNC